MSDRLPLEETFSAHSERTDISSFGNSSSSDLSSTSLLADLESEPGFAPRRRELLFGALLLNISHVNTEKARGCGVAERRDRRRGAIGNRASENFVRFLNEPYGVKEGGL